MPVGWNSNSSTWGLSQSGHSFPSFSPSTFVGDSSDIDLFTVSQILRAFPCTCLLMYYCMDPLSRPTPTHPSKPKIVSSLLCHLGNPLWCGLIHYSVITPSYNYLLRTIILHVVLEYSRCFINFGKWMNEGIPICWLSAWSCHWWGN